MNISITQLKVLQTNLQEDKPQLRGFKKTQKQFRRNILLKKKIATPNKFNKSQTILNTCTTSAAKMVRPESTSTSYHDRGYQDKNSFNQNFTSTANQSYNRGLQMNSDAIDKRMEQYLSVVFKKVELDTDKIIRVFEQNFDKKSKRRELPFSNNNFVKRLKVNSIKMRLKRQKQLSKLKEQGTPKLKISEAQSFIGKLIKTQTYLSPKRNKKAKNYDDILGKTNKSMNWYEPRRRLYTSIQNLQILPKSY